MITHYTLLITLISNEIAHIEEMLPKGDNACAQLGLYLNVRKAEATSYGMVTV